MPVQQRGLDSSQEQSTGALLRDTRSIGQRVSGFFKSSTNVAVLVAFLSVIGFVFPALCDLFFVISVTLFLISKTGHYQLPFRMPKRAHCKDYNTPKPGTNQPSMSSGIYFFGNDRKTDEELWFNNDDMRTHVLIFGSTGSGKTEALISIAFNALIQGSGFIYVDGKGDNSLFAKVFSMVRSMGREDDLLLINFMTGARDIVGPQEKRLSNTMNPFSRGSSSMLTQLVVSLMSSSSDQSSGDMWKGRAIAFVEALMRVLVAMRDAGYILLDANVIRNYFALDRLEAMVIDNIFIRDDQEAVSLEGMNSIVLEPMRNYVFNLPGYNKEKKGKQVSQVLEQHGYITMQLTRTFSSLADTYGHIIRTNLPEVDLRDVVLNRRILVVLLPALEKSPDELANLGKVIIASLKAMMASGLGDEVEGTYTEVVERKPTNARTPYLCILDEYGYYAVPGFAVVPAQARSLGFSVVFAGQDLPAFQKASKEEAASIGANTNIKICMKLEDPMETWEFFMKSAGEAHVAVVSGFQSDAKSMSGSYLDSKSAQMEKRSRIDLLDLKEQREGEYHIFFKSKIVRAKTFYANPKPVKELRLNQYVKVESPKDAVLRNFIDGFENFKKLIDLDSDVFVDIDLVNDEALSILELFAAQKTVSPIEKGVDVLLKYYDKGGDSLSSDASKNVIKLPDGELNLFAPLTVTDYIKEVVAVDDFEEFSKPILLSPQVIEQITSVESSLGRGKKNSGEIPNELIQDMQTATHYPLEVKGVPGESGFASLVRDFIKSVVLS